MSWDEQRRASPMLVDAFLSIREAEHLAAENQEEEARRQQEQVRSSWKK